MTVSKDSIDTRLIHADRKLNPTSAVVPPIYQTATFRGDSGEDFARRAGEARHPEFYTRYGNPTLSQVESVLATLEGTESALVTGSGSRRASTPASASKAARRSRPSPRPAKPARRREGSRIRGSIGPSQARRGRPGGGKMQVLSGE